MFWIYILKCDDGFGDDNYYYVGKTSRLFRRFWEHGKSCGGVNTCVYTPNEIVAIYKANTISKFIDCINYINENDSRFFSVLKYFNDYSNEDDHNDYYDAENYITECLMQFHKKEWDKIRGGKYIRFDVVYKFPHNSDTDHLPICKCGLPCDIKKNEDNYLFFRCPKKNMWNKFREIFHIDCEPCNFFMEYTKDKMLKLKANERSIKLKKLFQQSNWLNNIEIENDNYNQCVGGCFRTSKSIKLSYNNLKRNLCFDCFIDKYDALQTKYNICLIDD